MRTRNNDTAPEAAEGTAPEGQAAEAPIFVDPPAPPAPPAEEARKPARGEPGFTEGDKPDQVVPEDYNPEAELAKKRAAAPAKAGEKAPHEDWAKHFGMLPMMLDQPAIKWKTARSIPGRVNPKFDDYNRAKAHANWAPAFAVTEAEFKAAIAESAAHVFGSAAAARPTNTSK